MRLVDLPLAWTVLVDVLVWATWSTAAGLGGWALPARALDRDRGILRLRGWERGGRFYERRLRIKRWKDRLPEAGALFRGGTSKRHLAGPRAERLSRFAVETRRAELVHWAVLAAGPLFVLWNPWWLAAVMLLYAVAANVPCLLVQRYNRARIVRIG